MAMIRSSSAMAALLLGAVVLLMHFNKPPPRLLVFSGGVALATAAAVAAGSSAEAASERIASHKKPLCSDIKTTPVSGAWHNASFKPTQCHYQLFTAPQAARCLRGRRLFFAGDSLLRNVVTALFMLLDGAAFQYRWYVPDYGGMTADWHIDLAALNATAGAFFTTNNNARVTWRWAPSAFAPRLPSEEQTTAPFDAAVVSHGVWNLGASWEGARVFLRAINSTLAGTRAALPVAARVLAFQLHALHQSSAKCQANAECRRCNTPDRVAAFRAAVAYAAACQRTDVVDTVAVTTGAYARARSPDGVHYDTEVTNMELQVLLNSLCKLDDATGAARWRGNRVVDDAGNVAVAAKACAAPPSMRLAVAVNVTRSDPRCVRCGDDNDAGRGRINCVVTPSRRRRNP
jgi:hypothetical protein